MTVVDLDLGAVQHAELAAWLESLPPDASWRVQLPADAPDERHHGVRLGVEALVRELESRGYRVGCVTGEALGVVVTHVWVERPS